MIIVDAAAAAAARRLSAAANCGQQLDRHNFSVLLRPLRALAVAPHAAQLLAIEPRVFARAMPAKLSRLAQQTSRHCGLAIPLPQLA